MIERIYNLYIKELKVQTLTHSSISAEVGVLKRGGIAMREKERVTNRGSFEGLTTALEMMIQNLSRCLFLVACCKMLFTSLCVVLHVSGRNIRYGRQDHVHSDAV